MTRNSSLASHGADVHTVQIHDRDGTSLFRIRCMRRPSFETDAINAKRKPPREYAVGAWVYVHRNELDTTYVSSRKLVNRWTGPYQVSKAYPGGAYLLLDENGNPAFNSRPVNHLRLVPARIRPAWHVPAFNAPYNTPLHDDQEDPPPPNATPEEIDATSEDIGAHQSYGEDEEVAPPASLMIEEVDVVAKFRQFQETMADKKYCQSLSQDNIVDLTEGSRFLSDLGSKTTKELKTFLLNGVDFPQALNWENEELRDAYAFTVHTLKHDHYRSPDPTKLVICGFQASGFKLHLRVLLRIQGLFWLVPTKTVMLPQSTQQLKLASRALAEVLKMHQMIRRTGEYLNNLILDDSDSDAPASLDIKTTSATPAKAKKQKEAGK
ncbi:uncharacterized protein EV422DRAFT_564182 [Fimicolochytrium jonesii]|uniref:uncharacterized protein n=1 Tax=Fimicolochytrium jonesii TaxID=1396493 RepID=UPI0022FF45A1|nr:uncharacterized protein EV422DRAFT_564182 [Fimicolochytrium jonesii]KAI8824859.1 hypothetical protein EV422DRAFT_564182 [Fimicolochytrium jonesii]